MNDIKLMNKAADNIRILAASMVEKAKSGHPGGAMGGADFVNVLFSEFLVYDPNGPDVFSIPRITLTSGCPGVTLPHWRNSFSSSIVNLPARASTE